MVGDSRRVRSAKSRYRSKSLLPAVNFCPVHLSCVQGRLLARAAPNTRIRSGGGLDRRRLLSREGAHLTHLEKLGCVEAPEELNQFGDQTSPSGLMARSQAGSVITVEVFVEQEVVSPVRIGLKFLRAAINRPAARPITEKDPDQSLTDFMGHFKEIHFLARPGGTFNLEAVAVIEIEG